MNNSYFIADGLSLNRVPSPVDVSRKIKQYGESNLYPQIVHAIKLRSPLTKSAVDLIADFMKGDGWTTNPDLVVNRYGDTTNDVLSKVANDFAEYRGFSVHMNFNPLGQAVEMTHIPFEYCRLGLPNEAGISKDVKVSNNWENVDYDPNDPDLWDEKIQTYPIYEPLNPSISSRGAIYYYSDLGNGRYPLCSFDPILDNAQSDAEIQRFEVNNLVNGFHSGTIFKHYGPFEDDRARDRFIERIKEMTGANSGNSAMVVEVDEALENANLVEAIPANNNDTLFSQTTANIRNRVLQFFNIPGGLFAVSPENSVFTVTELGPSFVYMNLRTKNDRRTLERFFNRFVGVGEIVMNSFESDKPAADPIPEPINEPEE